MRGRGTCFPFIPLCRAAAWRASIPHAVDVEERRADAAKVSPFLKARGFQPRRNFKTGRREKKTQNESSHPSPARGGIY